MHKTDADKIGVEININLHVVDEDKVLGLEGLKGRERHRL